MPSAPLPPDTVLFDINETVLDLASLEPRFGAAFGDAAAVSTWFAMLLHSSTVCALTGVDTGFAELAGAALDALAARRGLSLGAEPRSAILQSFGSLKPHADVVPALTRLRAAGYRAVAFTNSSRNLLKRQLENAGLSAHFDVAISVQETGSFKPDAAVYRAAAERLQRPTESLRLVAAHDWDTHGALSAGLRAAYVQRSDAPYHPLYRRPDVFGRNLEEVVEAVLATDAGTPA